MKRATCTAVLLLAGLSLASAGPDDRRIEDAAKASYNYKTVLENRVQIAVRDGVATLTGTVEDEDQKSLAEDTVKNLPGVVGVDNRIGVSPRSPDHSDGWIALKIRGKLLVSGNVSAANTRVDVVGGNVHLTGTADNAAQRELTETYAKQIDGVKAVKNDLVIRGDDASGDARQRTAGEVIDDASITAQVKYALAAHKSTSALQTKVSTVNGNVLVTGPAANDAEKDLVTQLIREIRGVHSVNNQMHVAR